MRSSMHSLKNFAAFDANAVSNAHVANGRAAGIGVLSLVMRPGRVVYPASARHSL